MKACRWVSLWVVPLVAGAICAFPVSAYAAWEALQYVTIDPSADLSGSPDLEFVFAREHLAGFSEDTKVQGIAYVDGNTGAVSFATRSAPFESSIADAPWSVLRASNLFSASGPADLALDTVTGRPYIAYSDGFGEPWLTTYVGASAGNCGADQSWSCVNVLEACEFSSEVVHGGWPRVAAGGKFGEPADTVHVMFEIYWIHALEAGGPFVEARWSVASDSWTCDVSANLELGGPVSDAPLNRHDYDNRLKPQVLVNNVGPGLETQLRTLFDYVATPLPRWRFSDVFWAFPYLPQPDLALLDEGMFEDPPTLHGFGRPAIATALVDNDTEYYFLDPDCSYDKYARIYYRESEDSLFEYPQAQQVVDSGQVCRPDLAFADGGVPWIAYQDGIDDVWLAARDNGDMWTADIVMAGATFPEVVYDHVDTTATVIGIYAYGGVIVADGFWNP